MSLRTWGGDQIGAEELKDSVYSHADMSESPLWGKVKICPFIKFSTVFCQQESGH